MGQTEESKMGRLHIFSLVLLGLVKSKPQDPWDFLFMDPKDVNREAFGDDYAYGDDYAPTVGPTATDATTVFDHLALTDAPTTTQAPTTTTTTTTTEAPTEAPT